MVLDCPEICAVNLPSDRTNYRTISSRTSVQFLGGIVIYFGIRKVFDVINGEDAQSTLRQKVIIKISGKRDKKMGGTGLEPVTPGL